MSAISHARLPPRRRATLAASWWGKAWVRALEEWAFTDRDLKRARTLARSGAVGGITTRPGEFVAAVQVGDEAWPVRVTVPVLDRGDADAFVEVVAAESGRVAALLAGELPLRLAEDAEEAGVELLPYGGELGGSCGCPDWEEPCVHSLAVAHQLAWLLDEDPFVLLHVRGLAKEALLAGVRDRVGSTPERGDPDLDVALDAALRAARMLELLEEPEGSLDHLW